ncbi:MAG: glycosyltransferase family 39 protein [Actinomycetota bacterium]
MASQLVLPRSGPAPRIVALWLAVLAATTGAVVAVSRSGFEGQMYIVTVALVAITAAFVLPRAVARDGSLGVGFVATALAAHLIGSLFRFFIIQAVYHGVADANGYYGAGKIFAPAFRSLQFPELPSPYFGTPFVNWTTGILFAIIGSTLLGGFVVHSALAFVGGWFFYKAFRLAFPEGDHRLFAVLIFFLPSMWYWPSSLGKDSLVVMFLGLAVYGFARWFHGELLRGSVPAVVGLAGAFMVRPPIATALVVAATAAYLLRPTRRHSPHVTLLSWLVIVPLLSGIAFFTITHTATYLGNSNAIEAFQANRSTEFNTGESGSNFTPPNALSPTGLPAAVVTANFRPFAWEAGGLFPKLTSLEGVFLALLILARWRQIWRGIRRWRDNAMVLFAGAAFLAFSVILSSLSNFGLLARQRTQVLPFMFMLICMVAKPRRAPPARPDFTLVGRVPDASQEEPVPAAAPG